MSLSFCAFLFSSLASLLRADFDALVMGDWGGSSITYPNMHTTPAQRMTAERMGEIAAQINIEMVLALGDNIYLLGVEDEFDDRFQTTFEQVYVADSLQQMQFNLVAGNHDYYGNVTGEVEYTKHSERWNFPSLYYDLNYNVVAGDRDYTLQILMIDTVQLCGISSDDDYCLANGGTVDECDQELALLSKKTRMPDDLDAAQRQWAWIRQTLSESTADFLVVAGHYPIWSAASHGNCPCLMQELRPLLFEFDVNMYLYGHEHGFAFMVEEDVAPNLLYAMVGGTHRCRPRLDPNEDQVEAVIYFNQCKFGGFARMNVNEEGLAMVFYDGFDEQIQYTTKRSLPRTRPKSDTDKKKAKNEL